MKFNRWELKRIEQSLYTSIDSEEAFIGAHQTELKRIKGDIVTVIPIEHRSLVARTERTISAWKKILKKMQSNE